MAVDAGGPAARAFWLREPGSGEIRPVTLPVPGRDETLVRTVHSGVSRGTEALVFRGDVPASQYAVMRAPFQDGDFPGPVTGAARARGRGDRAELVRRPAGQPAARRVVPLPQADRALQPGGLGVA